MKTFTVIGYSVLNGERKVRIANDLVARVKILQRNGHTDIELYTLAEHDCWKEAIVTNKEEATALLAAHPDFARKLGSVTNTTQPEQDNTAEQELAEIKAWATINQSLVNNYKTSKPTFEMVLATIPMRENGRFIKKATREEMARQKLAELTA